MPAEDGALLSFILRKGLDRVLDYTSATPSRVIVATVVPRLADIGIVHGDFLLISVQPRLVQVGQVQSTLIIDGREG